MDLHLSGKRALVTGSTAGIGAAIARQLASEGAAVALHGRDEQRGQQLAAELTAAGSRVIFVGADLMVQSDVARLASQARAALGAIDILVNNAGVYPQHTWFEGLAAEWTRHYELNVVAGVRLIQELVPEMTRAGWGRVQISSGVGLRPFAHMPGYTATKAALHNITASLCQALAGTGVTVNAIAAGLIRTPEVEKWFYATFPFLVATLERLTTSRASPSFSPAPTPRSSTVRLYEWTVEVTAGPDNVCVSHRHSGRVPAGIDGTIAEN